MRYELPDEIRYCTRCVMPNTRPGLTMDADGVCAPCRAHEARERVEWAARYTDLTRLRDRYLGTGDGYDCAITVSSGKDSFVQVDTLRRLGFTPLLLSVGNFADTATGQRNAALMSDRFDCDMIKLNLPRKVARPMMRKAFRKLLAPCWYWDRVVYSWPLQECLRRGIKLVWWGEDIGYMYGGAQSEETPSAMDQMANDVVKPVDFAEWYGDGVEPRHFIPHQMPDPAIVRASLDPRYLSYYIPWSGYRHAEYARDRGWEDLHDEHPRQGLSEHYDQIDSVAYNVHPWLKFPKFGHQHQADVLSCWIREGRITRKHAAGIVERTEHILDPRMLDDFCRFVGIEEAEFWSTVRDWTNPRMLEWVGGDLRLKWNAIEALRNGGVMEE
jgi:N-acetyl sugar amidotransferase